VLSAYGQSRRALGLDAPAANSAPPGACLGRILEAACGLSGRLGGERCGAARILKELAGLGVPARVKAR
jgi:hypothetical protein